jgi:hypothetical protein
VSSPAGIPGRRERRGAPTGGDMDSGLAPSVLRPG